MEFVFAFFALEILFLFWRAQGPHFAMLEDDDLLDGVPHDAPEFTDADLLDEDAGEVPSLAFAGALLRHQPGAGDGAAMPGLLQAHEPRRAWRRGRTPRRRRVCTGCRDGKAKGNAAFVAQDFVAAAAEYEGALGAYGERGGAAGEQREEKAKICSNLAGSSSSSGRRRPRRRVTRWRSRRRTPRASCVAPRPP